MKKFKEFELAVKSIYEQLEPKATINHDEKLDGKISGIKRQIDVTIRSKVAGHEILIIVQCKDEKKNLDVNKVGEFLTVMNDVGAHRGILIGKKGFSKGALRLALRSGIDCCLLHDAQSKDWTQDLQIPIIFEDISAQFSWSLRVFLEKGTTINFDPKSFTISDINLHDHFIHKWNAGELNYEEGTHQLGIDLETQYLTDAQGNQIPCENVSINYIINKSFRLALVEELPSSKGIINLNDGSKNILFKGEDIANIRNFSNSKTVYSKIEDIPLKTAQHIRVLQRPELKPEMLENPSIVLNKVE